MQSSSVSGRIEWIDWMKSIGIYFIVLGHFFSIGYNYIYVFSVPLFFVISGFLCKHEEKLFVFWQKLWYNLLIPMLIISVVNFVFISILKMRHGTFDIQCILKFVINVLSGMHAGVGACWFVYTLILLKIICQYCNNDKTKVLLAILFLFGAYLYNHIDLSAYPHFKASSSIVNVCTAYPFFILGTFFRKYKNECCKLRDNLKIGLIFAVNTLLVYICGKINGYVWMYICGYGGNILLFLLGGTGGTMAVFAVSKILGSCPKYITIISRGTILILGFHGHAISLIRKFFPTATIWDFCFAALIVMAFVPLIMILEKYFPLILGKYRIVRQ